MAMPLCELTQYIREKHHRYVREAIRATQALFGKVTAKHGRTHPGVTEIGTVFTEVASEMIMHMQREEQILFPYIEALERAANGHQSVEPPFFQTVRNLVHAMMKEHDAAGELVTQIRSLTSDYLVPAHASRSFEVLYEALGEFDADFHQHVYLENNILFPRAIEMEAAVA